MANPFMHHLRLKRPCANCPFLKQDAIELAPGRLDGIITGLLEDDHSTFPCHKTVHSARGGEWDDNGNYTPSGYESMCAGAAAYLMKHKRPTVGMRIGFAMGVASPADWDDAQALTIE
ncbi:TPA: hypothetical protein ACRN02_005779 [Pseudomonas aeruginosa]